MNHKPENTADITAELRSLSRSAECCELLPKVFGKPISFYFAELADRIDAANASNVENIGGAAIEAMFVTDGRIALACRFYGFSFGGIAETTNARQKDIGERIIRNHIEATEAKIDSGKYCGYGMCSITEAVVAAFANVEPEMMYLRSKILDDDDPEADCLPNSVRYVHEAFTAVILANPARSKMPGLHVVEFRRGYRKDAPKMWFVVGGVFFRFSAYHYTWGEPIHPHYAIVLKERVELWRNADGGRL